MTESYENWEYRESLDTAETVNWQNENDLWGVEQSMLESGFDPTSEAVYEVQAAQDTCHYDNQWAIDEQQWDAAADAQAMDAYSGWTEPASAGAMDWSYANDYGDYSAYTGAYDSAGTYDAGSCSMIS